MSFRTKPQYLLPVPKAKAWELPFVFQRIYQIDYDITIKHLRAYPLVESLVGTASPTENRSIKPVIIITIYGGWENPSYRWYRPNIDAIVEQENFTLLRQLLDLDALRHI
jgi:hypothetical protein